MPSGTPNEKTDTKRLAALVRQRQRNQTLDEVLDLISHLRDDAEPHRFDESQKAVLSFVEGRVAQMKDRHAA